MMRWITIENFADRTDTTISEMIDEWDQQAARGRVVVSQAVKRTGKRADQPSPNCSLMIRSITVQERANVAWRIIGMGGSEAA